MKFKEWYNFVFCGEGVVAGWADVYVKVFRKRSFVDKDNCFVALLASKDAVELFGEYNIFFVSNHTENNYKTICVSLYR